MSFIILETLPPHKGHILVRAICHCGASKIIRRSTVLYGQVKSCGCARTIENKKRVDGLHLFNIKHGHRGKFKTSKTYNSWRCMFKRCYDPKHDNYAYYGGRGITVCSRWKELINFLEDMGERPQGMTIDRINPLGNYEPGNCRWATASEQNKNKRKNWR